MPTKKHLTTAAFSWLRNPRSLLSSVSATENRVWLRGDFKSFKSNLSGLSVVSWPIDGKKRCGGLQYLAKPNLCQPGLSAMSWVNLIDGKKSIFLFDWNASGHDFFSFLAILLPRRFKFCRWSPGLARWFLVHYVLTPLQNIKLTSASLDEDEGT